MPVITPVTQPTTEPVTLATAKVHLRVDGTEEDTYIGLLVSGARQQVENFCGRPFTSQTLAVTYELSEPYVLPPGAGEPTAVTGFFTDVAQLPHMGTWLEEYRKGITINREVSLLDIGPQTYTVTVAVTPDCPAVVQLAILELAAEWYKNRESSVNGAITVATKVDWSKKLAPYVRKTVLI